MAAALREHSAGVVLLAGNGHVRRDLGVPRWLSAADQARVFAVGFLEEGDPEGLAEAFDAVVHTARAERSDPCAAFESRNGLSERQGLPASPRAPDGFSIPLEALVRAGI
jgi:uncharacterized iron-regulated protein